MEPKKQNDNSTKNICDGSLCKQGKKKVIMFGPELMRLLIMAIKLL